MVTSVVDSVPDPRSAPGMKWGILAAGGIAHTFTKAIERTSSTVSAVGSRSQERAEQFAGEYGIGRAHGDYAALVADPEVEAVYIASPHSHHREHALLAIEAGKPILVEKAFTRSLAEADEVFAAAEAAGVFVLEAMWTRFLPHVAAIRALIADGAIGDLVSVTADHGQHFDFDPEHRLFNPDLAGGALLDLGVYPLGFILDVLGAPEQVTVDGQLTSTGVDGQFGALLRYPDDRMGVAHSTLWAQTQNAAVITGTEGRIEVDSVYYTPTTFRLVRRGDGPGGGSVEEFDGRVEDGHSFQIAETTRRVAEGVLESPLMSWQHTRDLMAVCDEVRARVGVRYPGE